MKYDFLRGMKLKIRCPFYGPSIEEVTVVEAMEHEITKTRKSSLIVFRVIGANGKIRQLLPREIDNYGDVEKMINAQKRKQED